MAKAPQQRTLVSRLADAGEEAIQKLGGAPGADRVLGAMNAMRDRMDEMQKQLRAIASIEKRLVAIERRLDKIEGKSTAPARRGGRAAREKRATPPQTPPHPRRRGPRGARPHRAEGARPAAPPPPRAGGARDAR